MNAPLSLYIHIPFCQRKCPYCDFNTYAGLNRLFEPFTAALVQEIRQAGEAHGRPAVRTVFLGGGTPTVLPVELLAQVIDVCHASFDVLPDAEITSEANPGTVDVARFAALRNLGVNRLSMGVQSFDPAELAFLGRIHSAGEAVAAMDAARAAGFDNINLDFIYGLPDQPPITWRRTLEQAIDLAPEHISLYSLTIEEGTPFGDWAAAGRLAQPSPDLAADMYEIADEMLSSSGYVQYEISNWARPDESTNLPIPNPHFACRHNLTYWRNETYLGFGPGAHSSQDGRRWAAIRPVPEYIERIMLGDSVVDFVEEIDDRLAMAETMMLGLRLVREGVTFQRFQQRHGQSMLDVFGTEIERLERLGLLERLADRVRLTRAARLVGNQVFAAFLP
ncbi:MAG: radical SAM family heme chaperone HemW [Anaerolineae bacterium]